MKLTNLLLEADYADQLEVHINKLRSDMHHEYIGLIIGMITKLKGVKNVRATYKGRKLLGTAELDPKNFLSDLRGVQFLFTYQNLPCGAELVTSGKNLNVVGVNPKETDMMRAQLFNFECSSVQQMEDKLESMFKKLWRDRRDDLLDATGG